MCTTSEKKYVELIVTMIMKSECGDAEKTKRMKSFLENHTYCYENFCFDVYRLTTMQGTNVLTMDDYGVSYVNLIDKDNKRKYYDVLTLNEYSPCCSDLIIYIDIALEHLLELLLEEEHVELL